MSREDAVRGCALVSYIPDPLGQFLAGIHEELVPGTYLRPHVMILPPRPLKTSWKDAWSQIRRILMDFPPLNVALTEVNCFPITDVIYLEIGKGSQELKTLHSALNTGAIEFDEPFPFHPFVTLVNSVLPSEVDELLKVARQRWTDFNFSRSFRMETIAFVHQDSHGWMDLAATMLGHDITDETEALIGLTPTRPSRLSLTSGFWAQQSKPVDVIERRPKRLENPDRVVRQQEVLAHARSTFGEKKSEHWLHRPNQVFGGLTPIQWLEVNPEEVERELVRIDHGVYL